MIANLVSIRIAQQAIDLELREGSILSEMSTIV